MLSLWYNSCIPPTRHTDASCYMMMWKTDVEWWECSSICIWSISMSKLYNEEGPREGLSPLNYVTPPIRYTISPHIYCATHHNQNIQYNSWTTSPRDKPGTRASCKSNTSEILSLCMNTELLNYLSAMKRRHSTNTV